MEAIFYNDSISMPYKARPTTKVGNGIEDNK
jgi:hypothetical protein